MGSANNVASPWQGDILAESIRATRTDPKCKVGRGNNSYLVRLT